MHVYPREQGIKPLSPTGAPWWPRDSEGKPKDRRTVRMKERNRRAEKQIKGKKKKMAV